MCSLNRILNYFTQLLMDSFHRGHQVIGVKLKLTEVLSLQTHLPILSTSAPETCKLSECDSHSFFKNKQKALGGVFSKRLLG